MPASSSVVSRLVTDLGAARVRVDTPELRRQRPLPFALPALDDVLDGGLPRGAITEIVGRVSSGRTTLGYTLLASATRAGEFVAWIDMPNAFDPESLSEAGANVGHVLWLRPRDRQGAIRAVEHVLEAGGFRLVVLDLDGALSRPFVPTSSWLRITRAAVHRDAAIVVLGTSGLVGSCAALSLEVRSLRRVFDGETGPYPMFEGTASALFLRRRRFGPPTDATVDLFASACG